MRYYVLLLLISAGAYAAASTLSAIGVSAAWGALARRVLPLASRERARVLALLRLLPQALGALTALVLSIAFLRFEPGDTTESPGLLLIAAASFALGLTAVAVLRLSRALVAGRECLRLVRQCGHHALSRDGHAIWIVDTDYPLAAVTGILRTRLLVSRRIVAECTERELDAVIRHEAAHVRRRDNLVRAAMHYLPDPLRLLPAGAPMIDAWSTAAEESADEEAAGPQGAARTDLASALVRVARMADGPPPRWMPALAFYEGSNLEHRVRRLLHSPALATGGTRYWLLGALLAAGAGALTMTEAVARQIHGLMEVAVRVLP